MKKFVKMSVLGALLVTSMQANASESFCDASDANISRMRAAQVKASELNIKIDGLSEGMTSLEMAETASEASRRTLSAIIHRSSSLDDNSLKDLEALDETFMAITVSSRAAHVRCIVQKAIAK